MMLSNRVGLLAGLVAAVSALALAGAVTRPSVARADTACPWMDVSQTPDQRAHELVVAMTIDQKISLVHQHSYMAPYGTAGYIPGDSSLCMPDLLFSDSGQGVGGEQQNTVAFAAPIAQTATWDPQDQYGWGSHVGWEAWHKGIDIQLAPAFDMARVPMNGRTFEYMGEDPYLASQGAVNATRGLQSQHVIATLKHYAFNEQETNRMTDSSDLDLRTAHEIYLPPFEAGVKAGAGSVMCSYNRINLTPPFDSANSIYACEDPQTLNGILKGELGFKGWVMSDWDATHSTVPAALAGLDQEMSVTPAQYYDTALKTAVQDGQVPESRLDDMVFRITRSMFAVGVFDHPPVPEPQGLANNVETPDELAFALKLGEDGSVLLKNQNNILPLDGVGKKIAVIGRTAAPDGALDVYNGGGSAHIPTVGDRPDVVAPITAITQRALANGDTVVYDHGDNPTTAGAVASTADVAIVFGSYTMAEGSDRTDLSLDNSGDQLISAVAGANPNTIVVLNTGSAVTMPWLDQVKGVLENWYPGQEYGNVVSALLFGDASPSGKLPITFPKSVADIPTQTPDQWPGVTGADGIPHSRYSEGLLIGYRWYDAKGIEPLFPFGYGLTYTTFRFSGLSVKPVTTGQGATATFTITNTGTRPGAEVGQVYVGFPAVAGEPPKQLKGFQKVSLQPGQSQTVTIPLDGRAFSYWNASTQAWTIPGGTFTVMVGDSSRDLPLVAKVTPRR
jgi:beta-glucosidase